MSPATFFCSKASRWVCAGACALFVTGCPTPINPLPTGVQPVPDPMMNPAPQPTAAFDCQTTFEPDNDAASATPLASTQRAGSAMGDPDWYRVDMQPGQTSTFRLRATGGDLDLGLLDAQFGLVDASELDGGNESITYTASGPETLYVIVDGFETTSCIPYDLDWLPGAQPVTPMPGTPMPDTPPEPSCPDDGLEPNDSFSVSIGGGVFSNNLNVTPNDPDVYGIQVPVNRLVRGEATNIQGGTINIELFRRFDGNDTLVLSDDSLVEAFNTADQIYFARVTTSDPCVTYTFDLSVE